MNRAPTLTTDMILPVDTLISTSEAKRLFKVWMIKIGYYSASDKDDKDLLDEHTAMFADEIKQHELVLRDEVKTISETDLEIIGELKDKIRSLRKKQIISSVEIYAELQDAINAYEEQLELFSWPLKKAMKVVNRFKKDKREFLVDYINWQVHGAEILSGN